MNTGFFIEPEESISGPFGRTEWRVEAHGPTLNVCGSGGDSGWRIVGGWVFDPAGHQTGWFLLEQGQLRQLHGPEPILPWDPP